MKASALLCFKGGENLKEENAGWRYLMRRTYAPQYSAEQSEPVVCTRFERCIDCPYPAHGFICWQSEEKCMRTMVEKIQERKEAK